jgi:hypothetical protein
MLYCMPALNKCMLLLPQWLHQAVMQCMLYWVDAGNAAVHHCKCMIFYVFVEPIMSYACHV